MEKKLIATLSEHADLLRVVKQTTDKCEEIDARAAKLQEEAAILKASTWHELESIAKEKNLIPAEYTPKTHFLAIDKEQTGLFMVENQAPANPIPY